VRRGPRLERIWQWSGSVGFDVGFLTPLVFGFLLVLFRCTALCSVAPFLGMKTVPRRARMGIAFVLAFVAYAGGGFPGFRGGMGSLLGAAVLESLIGLVAGLSASFAIDAASAAGQMASVSMGLSYGSVIDPLHGADSTAIAELLSMFSVAAIVMSGMHREIVGWVCRSVIEMPPGSTVGIDPAMLASAVVNQAIAASALAVRMAFPILVSVFFGHVALGVVGRTVPQLNVNSIGFSVTILAGGAALYLLAPPIAELAARTATAAFSRGM
jgi:flagellar biosynthetic protein FliR